MKTRKSEVLMRMWRNWNTRVWWSNCYVNSIVVPQKIENMPTICCCSIAKSCLTLYDSMDGSIPGSSVLHYLPQLAQIHVH